MSLVIIKIGYCANPDAFAICRPNKQSSGMSVGISGRAKTFLFGNLFLDVFFPLNSDKLSQRRPTFAVPYREISEYIITR